MLTHKLAELMPRQESVRRRAAAYLLADRVERRAGFYHQKLLHVIALGQDDRLTLRVYSRTPLRAPKWVRLGRRQTVLTPVVQADGQLTLLMQLV